MRTLVCVLSLASFAACAAPFAVATEDLGKSFVELRDLIKPSPGESPWFEINWYSRVQEAREKAAAEGKPLVIYIGGNNGSVGGTC